MLGASSSYTAAAIRNVPMFVRGPFFLAYLACLTILASLALYFLPHVLQGDAVSYVDAAKAYASGSHLSVDLESEVITPEIVAVHRMLTTTLAIEVLRFFAWLTGSFEVGWLVMDTILYFAGGIALYILLMRFYDSERVAFIGGLFFAANYTVLSQGMGYFMDIAGWFFYIFALLLLYLYMESNSYRTLMLAALVVAVGGFFKENAYMAAIPIGTILLFENYNKPLTFLAKSIPLGLLVVTPAVYQHIHIYREYGYTYTYWIRISQDLYEYNSIIIEYIKSFGSLLTFFAPVALLGAYEFIRRLFDQALETRKKVYIVAVLVSSIPAVMWPAITQRVIFLAVPGLILLAGLAIHRWQRHWYAFLPFVALYAIAGLTMDAYILDLVNLPF